MFGTNEAGFNRMVDLREQRVIKTYDVQQTARFPVQAKLGPSKDLTKLLQRPIAAWERDESASQLGHKRFPLVHRLHDSQLRQTAMRQFLFDQRLRDHANDLSTLGQRGICHHAHQSDIASTVNKVKAMFGNSRAHLLGSPGVNRVCAMARAAKNTNPLHAEVITSTPRSQS